MNKLKIDEWAESPVNQKLVKAIQSYVDELRLGTDAYHPFEPYRTQETLANLNGAIDTWEIVIDLLQGDWDFLEEEDESGDIP